MSWTSGLALAACLAAVWFAWRLASRRRSLPCPAWLGALVERDNPFARTNRAAEIIGLLDVRPGMAVLDAGCGPGRLTVPLARAVGPEGSVTAVDLQSAMLARAEEKTRAAGLGNVRFAQCALESCPLGEGEFHRAVLVTVLGEIPDKAAALGALFRALRPGGVLSVTEVVLDPHFQGRGAVTRLALDVGFSPPRFFGNRLAYTLHFHKPKEHAPCRP